VKRCFLSSIEVKENTGWQISDFGNTHLRETQYMQTIDLYWKMKTIMGRVLVEISEAQLGNTTRYRCTTIVNDNVRPEGDHTCQESSRPRILSKQ